MKNNKLSIGLIFSLTLLILTLSLASFSGQQPVHAYDVWQYFLPLITQQGQPPHSTSYYLTTVDESFLFNLGCELGTRDQFTNGAQDSVAVLDFSYPTCNEDGLFGADLFGYGPASLENITSASKSFAMGYYTCSGSDHSSNLVIGVGTNNKPKSCQTESQATAHGSAWAQMVTEINHWAFTEGIIHQVQAYGASDIEVGWNTPDWSRAWIAGFEKGSGNFLIHFGDASGCPYEDNPHWSCGTKAFPEWTVEDVWFVSWGSPSALPLPLIYLTNGIHAKQWAYLSQYSVIQHGYRMDFTGVFTEYQFCEQFHWPSCEGRDNTPFEAYYQLSTELNKDPLTAQVLRWKTDIRWILPEEWKTTSSRSVSSSDNDMETFIHPIEGSISNLESILTTSDLSPLLQKSLETKLEIYQDLARQIAASMGNPAPKDLQTGN